MAHSKPALSLSKGPLFRLFWFQVVREHHVIVRTRIASRRCVETHRRLIAAIGEHPGFPATQTCRMLQECLNNGLADPMTMMAWSDGDFVDPEVRGLVRMDVVHTRRESDDLPLIDGNRQMMPFVLKELCHERRIERVVEDAWRDVPEKGVVAGLEHSDLRHHVLFVLCNREHRIGTRSRSTRRPSDSRW